jgi:hypothetical protein
MMAPRARSFVDGIFDQPRSLRAAALMRMLVGPLVLVHLWPFLREMAHGRYYGDAFYSPWVAWLPEPSKPVYFALLALGAVAAILFTVGAFTGLTGAVTWSVVAYNFFLSQTHFHNNRTYLLIVLGCLALTPCGRLLSLDGRRARRHESVPDADARAPLWPLYLLRFEALCVYLGSGGSKLLDGDWRAGIVTWDRVLRFRHRLEVSIAPDWLVALVTREDFHAVFAKVAIATEIGVALGLVWRRTRLGAIWVAIVFHVVIGVALQVEIFSVLAIAALLAWVTHESRDRVIEIDRSVPAALACERWMRRLDWLARFRWSAAGPAATLASGDPQSMETPAFALVDRDGRRLRDGEAVLVAVSRCPAMFPLAAPLLLPGLRQLAARVADVRLHRQTRAS